MPRVGLRFGKLVNSYLRMSVETTPLSLPTARPSLEAESLALPGLPESTGPGHFGQLRHNLSPPTLQHWDFL